MIDVPTTLKKGVPVDIAVTPGPGLDTAFDNVGCRVMILAPRSAGP